MLVECGGGCGVEMNIIRVDPATVYAVIEKIVGGIWFGPWMHLSNGLYWIEIVAAGSYNERQCY